MGYEMLTVEMTGQGNSSVLRIYIDSPDGITVEDCARVSDQISAILEVEDPVSGRYTLEVSSPGFDRPLCKLSHFEAVVGQMVKIQTAVQISGRRRFTGKLTDVTSDIVTLDIEGQVHAVPVSNIMKARLVPDYGADPLTN